MARFEDLQVGDVVAARDFTFTRDTLVRYAGASLDFNPIHYRDDVAQSVGLPGVLAHGMLTMGAASSVVAEWLGEDEGSDAWIADYQSRFTKPVPVDATEGASLSVTATVGKLDEEAREARIDLKVQLGDLTVLGKSQVVVRFPGTAA